MKNLGTLLNAGDLFDELSKENGEKIKRFEIVKTPALNEILTIYDKWMKWLQYARHTREDPEDFYEDYFYTAMNLLTKREYSSKDIATFLLALKSLEQNEFFEYSGHYISALIENSYDQEFILFTKHLEIPLSWIGHHNTKNIIIEGNVGSNFAQDMAHGKISLYGDQIGAPPFLNKSNFATLMDGGTVVVYGNVSDVGLEMKKGHIEIHGNAEEVGNQMIGGKIAVFGDVRKKGSQKSSIGYFMSGGVIEIRGNLYGDAGVLMDGGVIHLHGNYESIAYSISGGDIYYKGRLIVKNGRRVG